MAGLAGLDASVCRLRWLEFRGPGIQQELVGIRTASTPARQGNRPAVACFPKSTRRRSRAIFPAMRHRTAAFARVSYRSGFPAARRARSGLRVITISPRETFFSCIGYPPE